MNHDPFTLNRPTAHDDVAAEWTAEQQADYYDATRGEYIAPGVPVTEVSLAAAAVVELAASTPPARLTPEAEEYLARTALGDRRLFDSSTKRADAICQELVAYGLMDVLGIVTGRGLWLLRQVRDDPASPSKGLARQALDARKPEGWGPDTIDDAAQGRD